MALLLEQGRFPVLEEAKEALKQRILDVLYQRAVEELGDPEAVARLAREHIDEQHDVIRDARAALKRRLLRQIAVEAVAELGREVGAVDAPAAAPAPDSPAGDGFEDLARRLHGADESESVEVESASPEGEDVSEEAIVEEQHASLEGGSSEREKVDDGWDVSEEAAVEEPEASAVRDSREEDAVEAHEQYTIEAPEDVVEKLPPVSEVDQWHVTISCDAEALREQIEVIHFGLESAVDCLPVTMLDEVKKGMALGAEEELEAITNHVRERCHRALLAYAVDGSTTHHPVAGGEGPQVVLDAVYTVEDADAVAFQTELRRLIKEYNTEAGFTFELATV